MKHRVYGVDGVYGL